MVHVLGVQMPDRELVRRALTHFYGIGPNVAHRICARLQIHDRCRVHQLTSTQVTSIASFLSSPSTAPIPPRYPLAPPGYQPPPPDTPIAKIQAAVRAAQGSPGPRVDPLKSLKIESELKRQMRENIAHQRMIGSYVGRRHAMGLPVRGQNTQNNAKTAKKLNRIERWF